jgi:hypothetical protein
MMSRVCFRAEPGERGKERGMDSCKFCVFALCLPLVVFAQAPVFRRSRYQVEARPGQGSAGDPGGPRELCEVEGIAANAQRRTNAELLETATAGYATANVKAGWHAKQTTITLGLDNALNRFY